MLEGVDKHRKAKQIRALGEAMWTASGFTGVSALVLTPPIYVMYELGKKGVDLGPVQDIYGGVAGFIIFVGFGIGLLAHYYDEMGGEMPWTVFQ